VLTGIETEDGAAKPTSIVARMMRSFKLIVNIGVLSQSLLLSMTLRKSLLE